MPGLQMVFKNFDLPVIVVLFFSKDKEFFIKHKFSKIPTSIPNKLFSPYHFSISTMIYLLIVKLCILVSLQENYSLYWKLFYIGIPLNGCVRSMVWLRGKNKRTSLFLH